MNAVARVINQSNLFSGHLADMRLSKSLCFRFALLMVVLLSALAVIYETNEQRTAFSKLEAAEQQTRQLQLQWGQLLLEQASLATPARVQALAMEKIHMVLPADKEVIVLRAL